MLNLSTVFFILINIVVSPFYLLIIVAPHRRLTRHVLGSFWPLALPAAVHVAFIALIVALSRPDVLGLWRALYVENGMLSSATIRFLSQLYGRYPEFAILHGWVHIVVGDIFMARWAYLDALTRSTPGWLISLSALLMLFTGPVGVIVYLVLRPRFTHVIAVH